MEDLSLEDTSVTSEVTNVTSEVTSVTSEVYAPMGLKPILNPEYQKRAYRARMHFLLTSVASKDQTTDKVIEIINKADPDTKTLLLSLCESILKEGGKEHVFIELKKQVLL